MQKKEKILIIHLYGLGDWIYFTPTLKAIRDYYPDSEIHVLNCSKHITELIELYPEVDEVYYFKNKPRYSFLFNRIFLTYKNRYSIILFSYPADQKSEFVLRFMRGEKKILYTYADKIFSTKLYFKPNFHSNLHYVEECFKILDFLSIPKPKQPTIFIPLTQEYYIKNSVIIHPGNDAANAYKRYPAERFAEITDELLKKGINVSVILGPQELDLESYFTSLFKLSNFNIYKNLSIKDTIKIISNYELLLASDSGLTHIAAALGRKVVTIFGPGNPKRNAPYSDKTLIIKTDLTLECMPCTYPGGKRGCDDRPCLASIKPSFVLEKTLDFLK